MKVDKKARRNKIRRRIRSKVHGDAQRPRLSVYRSNNHIYAQVIDDLAGVTLVSANSLQLQKSSEESKTDIARKVGEDIARQAKDADIMNVVFDRGGYLYHGRVKALAEGAREGGLKL